MDFVIRKADATDIPAIFELARSVERMISPEEIQTWMQVDNEAFSVAETAEDPREIVGTCCGVRLDQELGFMGLYIVREGFRGRGLGSRLWKSSLEHLGDRNVGTRGEEPQFWKYKDEYGFQHVTDYRIAYYEYSGPMEGLGKKNMLVGDVDIITFNEGRLTKIHSSNEVVSCSNSGKFFKGHTDQTAPNVLDILNKIKAYDQSLHNRDRSLVLTETFSSNSCLTKVALVSDNVVGYGCLRPVIPGHWLISPFYADSVTIAEVLLQELLGDFDFAKVQRGIRVRFPDKNTQCKDLLEKYGFADTQCRILTGFTKYFPEVNICKIYSFHSVAFCSE